MMNEEPLGIDYAKDRLNEKEQQFLIAANAVEVALANGETGVLELEELRKIAGELAELTAVCSKCIELAFYSFSQ